MRFKVVCKTKIKNVVILDADSFCGGASLVLCEDPENDTNVLLGEDEDAMDAEEHVVCIRKGEIDALVRALQMFKVQED